ncbi:hypothetical protein KKD72_02005 [Patescibacteria group bacterium]|nr:hypothetical protein [Patescibacteria group bacterium]
MNKKVLLILLIIFVIGAGAAAYFWYQPNLISQEQTGETANWKTFIPTDKGATFQYPENLSTNYIHPQEWPPKLLIIDNTGFSCEQGGLGINGRPGMTIQKKINNIVYCIDSVSEGTAGTFYTSYTYTFLKDSKLAKLSFTLAYSQCANYNEPQKTECEQERQTFDLDVLINRIAESVR